MLITLLIILAGLVLTSCEMDIKKPSSSIQQAFAGLFPGASHVQWEREGGLYKAEFVMDGHETEAWFGKDASWLRTKTDISWVEVPDPVKATINEYADGDWETDDISLYRQSTGVPEYYHVELDRENSDRDRQLRIRPDGTLITDLR